MNTLRAMRLFIEIAEKGSLTDAAKSLGKSLPTVVRTLAELEQHLGCILVHRTTRRMSLSQEGELYLERARQILNDVDEAADLVSGTREPRGHLRIGAPVLFGQMHVSPLSVAFAKAYEKVSVELVLQDKIIDLIDARIDVALRIGKLADSSLIAQRVGSMRRVVVASPELLAERGTPKKPKALLGLPCVRFLRGGPIPWLFQEGGEQYKLFPQGRFAANQVAAAVEACEASMGFGCFLHYQVENALKYKRLKVVLRSYELEAMPVNLVYRGAKTKSARVNAYVTFMKKALRQVRSLRDR